MTASEVATSAAYLRQVNERTVFKRVFELAPASVTQLVRETGLSKPTVGLALAHLEQVGLVQKVGLRTGAAGRAPQLFGPRPEAGWVVAIDVGLRWVGVLLADLTGTIAGQSRRRSKGRARGVVDQIGDMVDELLANTHVAPDSVLNVVVGSPGVYDETGHRVRHASNLPGWERPDLVRTLRERLGEHIAFENDVDLAALGEQAYGLGRGVDNFVYLHIGSGLGIGAVLGGKLHRGAHGTAGEVAFLPVVAPESGPAALRRGLLETAAAADGLVAAARRHGLTTASKPEDVLAAAKADEPAAVRAMADELDHLTTALAAVMTLLDPELVVLGGGVGRHLGDYLVPLRQRLAALLPLPVPAFAVSALGDDATLLGGLASGLSNARERALQRAEAM